MPISILGMTYKYLGELEKAIEILYKSLEVNTNNLGMKILALTDILICEFIIGEFNQVPKHYKEIAHLIDKGGLQEIKEEKNILHSVVFPKFVSEVYTTIVESAHLSLKSKIPHIGESHCLSFAYQSLFISSQTKYIQPVLIEGGKAFHLAKNIKNKWKSSLVKQIEKYKSSEEIFITFGEIDCRADEGILQFAKKKKLNIEQVCFETVNNYINYMELTLSPFFSSRYYFGVPAPVILTLTPTHLDKTRIELIKFFNQVLKNEVLRRDSFFIDVFELTTNENFENNKIHMIDNTHLSSTCLPLLFKKHLYSKSN
jgi:tetratricopeptide (TPR) repeat protein